MDSYERKFRRDRAVRLTLSALWIGFCTFLWKRFCFAVYAGIYGAVLSFVIGAVVTLWPLYKLDALRYLYDRSFSGIVTDVKRERVVGDRVVYHRGTKFPLISKRRFCACCGSLLRDDEEKCVECFSDAPIDVNKE